RLEIEDGMRENLLVIPILVQRARVPTKADLPNGLAALPGIQALTITDDWDAGVTKLVTTLDGVVRRAASTEQIAVAIPDVEPEVVEEPADHPSPHPASGVLEQTAPEPIDRPVPGPERPSRRVRT